MIQLMDFQKTIHHFAVRFQFTVGMYVFGIKSGLTHVWDTGEANGRQVREYRKLWGNLGGHSGFEVGCQTGIPVFEFVAQGIRRFEGLW